MSKVQHNCQQCNKIFFTYACFNHKFCSNKCKGLANSQKHIKEKICPKCNQSFYDKTYSNKKFCSRECFTHKITIIRNCIYCGKKFIKTNLHPSRIKIEKYIYCSPQCSRLDNPPIYKSGEEHWHWKGGIGKTVQGYIRLYDPTKKGNRDTAHRIIVEQALTRKLSSKEIVHHINGDKTDNRIENLYLCSSRKEHLILHGKQYKPFSNLIKF